MCLHFSFSKHQAQLQRERVNCFNSNYLQKKIVHKWSKKSKQLTFVVCPSRECIVSVSHNMQLLQFLA